MVEKEPWHLDKKVPISLVVVLLVQTGSFIWWASGVDSRITQIELDRVKQEQQIVTNNDQFLELNTKLTRLETRFEYWEKAQQEANADIKILLEEVRD